MDPYRADPRRRRPMRRLLRSTAEDATDKNGNAGRRTCSERVATPMSPRAEEATPVGTLYEPP
eukprot:5346028-Alexandrium_andersonii.AAC.1